MLLRVFSVCFCFVFVVVGFFGKGMEDPPSDKGERYIGSVFLSCNLRLVLPM